MFDLRPPEKMLVVILILLALGEGVLVFRMFARMEQSEQSLSKVSVDISNLASTTAALAAKIEILSGRTDDIEKVAAAEIAGFKERLLAEAAGREALESALHTEKQSRELSEIKRAADLLQQKIELEQGLALLRTSISDSISTSDLAKIIDTWQPRIAAVSCKYTTGTSRGSGVLMRFDDETAQGTGVLTNRHVLITESGLSPSSCTVTLPDVGASATALRVNDDIEAASSGQDFGRIVLRGASSAFTSITETPIRKCGFRAKVGDSVLILGYPSIGAEESMTATDGIISGYDDDYYVTSAKVEKGNSGGAAIHVAENCMLGIPTFVRRGSIESLARILDIQVIE